MAAAAAKRARAASSSAGVGPLVRPSCSMSAWRSDQARPALRPCGRPRRRSSRTGSRPGRLARPRWPLRRLRRSLRAPGAVQTLAPPAKVSGTARSERSRRRRENSSARTPIALRRAPRGVGEARTRMRIRCPAVAATPSCWRGAAPATTTRTTRARPLRSSSPRRSRTASVSVSPRAFGAGPVSLIVDEPDRRHAAGDARERRTRRGGPGDAPGDPPINPATRRAARRPDAGPLHDPCPRRRHPRGEAARRARAAERPERPVAAVDRRVARRGTIADGGPRPRPRWRCPGASPRGGAAGADAAAAGGAQALFTGDRRRRTDGQRRPRLC